MIKVKKIYLRRGYTPINKNIFTQGRAISFDCFIQRFNGFALWIEKGTTIDGRLMNVIKKNGVQLFVSNQEVEPYHQEMRKISTSKPMELEPVSLQEAIQQALSLDEDLGNLPTKKSALEYLYKTSKTLINAWSDLHKKPLPLEAFYKISRLLVDYNRDRYLSFSDFNSFLDESYSLSAHMTKVAFFASIIGAKLGLHVTDQEKLVLAGLIHDAGKNEVDETLLEKPQKLTPDEFKAIQLHVNESVIVAKQCGIRDRAILDGIGEHHERLDGSGYPHQFIAAEISQFGKILAVCDVFDALITHKPYRGAYTTFNALMLIKQEYTHKLDSKYLRLLISALQ